MEEENELESTNTDKCLYFKNFWSSNNPFVSFPKTGLITGLSKIKASKVIVDKTLILTSQWFNKDFKSSKSWTDGTLCDQASWCPSRFIVQSGKFHFINLYFSAICLNLSGSSAGEVLTIRLTPLIKRLFSIKLANNSR